MQFVGQSLMKLFKSHPTKPQLLIADQAVHLSLLYLLFMEQTRLRSWNKPQGQILAWLQGSKIGPTLSMRIVTTLLPVLPEYLSMEALLAVWYCRA